MKVVEVVVVVVDNTGFDNDRDSKQATQMREDVVVVQWQHHWRVSVSFE